MAERHKRMFKKSKYLENCLMHRLCYYQIGTRHGFLFFQAYLDGLILCQFTTGWKLFLCYVYILANMVVSWHCLIYFCRNFFISRLLCWGRRCWIKSSSTIFPLCPETTDLPFRSSLSMRSCITQSLKSGIRFSIPTCKSKGHIPNCFIPHIPNLLIPCESQKLATSSERCVEDFQSVVCFAVWALDLGHHRESHSLSLNKERWFASIK